MKPHGALSKDELLALVKPGQDIYKVFDTLDGAVGHISRAVLTGKHSGQKIDAADSIKDIFFDTWFEKRYGYLFDNYFHALAYSLKLKAEHGQKAKSEERTGMAGAP